MFHLVQVLSQDEVETYIQANEIDEDISIAYLLQQ